MKTMQFRKDNKIKYAQDHRFGFVGIPSGVEFTVEHFQLNGFKLTGYGYGKNSEDEDGDDAYGDGCLYVSFLKPKQVKRFDTFCDDRELVLQESNRKISELKNKSKYIFDKFEEDFFELYSSNVDVETLKKSLNKLESKMLKELRGI